MATPGLRKLVNGKIDKVMGGAGSGSYELVPGGTHNW